MIKVNQLTIGLLLIYSARLWAGGETCVSPNDTKMLKQNNFVQVAQKKIKLSGYVDAGYSYNFTGASDGASDVTGRFGSDTPGKGDFNLYALKVALEKTLNSENKAQAGFRTDVILGEDANYLIHRGTGYNLSNTNQNSNSLFLEQAYVSLRAPIGNGWDFKVGKFVSILGYEVIERPANINITYGLLWQQMPLYYTGVLSSYKFDNYLEGKIGVVNGSQTDNNTTTSGNGDGCALLAALDVISPDGNANWSNNFQYSSNNDNNSSQSTIASSTSTAKENDSSGTGYVFIYNSWGNWTPKIADNKLLLAFNALLGTASTNHSEDNSQPGTTWYGAGAYGKYEINDWFSIASRGEYLGGNNSKKLVSGLSGKAGRSGLSLWEYTLTAGFNIIDGLLVRAEYRIDWGSNAVNNYFTNGSNSAFSNSGLAHYAGAEVVYSF